MTFLIHIFLYMDFFIYICIMKNKAIINAAKMANKRTHIPKSLRGKIEIVVNDDGIKLIKVKKL